MRIALTLVLLPLVLAGCARRAERNPADYHTIARDLRRDTDLARRENGRAVELIRQERLEEAEKLLKKALAADITFGPAHNNLGKVYYHQSKMYLAAWEFQYAIKLMPNHTEPRNNLGLVFEAVGKLDEAAGAYAEARAIEDDNPHVIGNLARVWIRQGRRDESVRELLDELVMKDTRSDWVEWAREQRARIEINPLAEEQEARP